MIDPGSGRIPLIAHSLAGFTMEGTGMVEHWKGDYSYLREK